MAGFSSLAQKGAVPAHSAPPAQAKADGLTDPLQGKVQMKEDEKKPQMKRDKEKPAEAAPAAPASAPAAAAPTAKMAKQARAAQAQAGQEPTMSDGDEEGNAGWDVPSAGVDSADSSIAKMAKQAKAAQAQEEEEAPAAPSAAAAPTAKMAKQAKAAQAQEEEEAPAAPSAAAAPTAKMAKQAREETKDSTAPKTGGGSPLPGGVRNKMESSFGTDFSDVRVKEDAGAKDAGALAYASGNELTFAPGQYNPESQKGQELIGHELSHVVQQREGRVPAAPQGKEGFNQVPSLESEADAQGAKAARGEPVSARAQSKQAKQAKQAEGPVNLNEALAKGDATASGNTIQLKEDAGRQANPNGGGGKTDFGGAAPELSFELGGKEYKLSWDKGPKAEIDLGGIKYPEDGWKTGQSFPVNLVPGAGVIFAVEVGGSVSLSGKVAFGIKKDGSKWSISMEKIGAEATLGVYGEVSIGGFLGVKGANISASAYARATAEAKVAVNGSAGITYDKGQWGGALDLGFNVEAALKAEVGVKANWEFLFWDGELGRFRLGEWYLASAGLGGKFGKSWPGGKTNKDFTKPWIKWGKPPEPQEA